MGVVTEGIIAMPYELAMADELTRMQFYQTVTSEIAALRTKLETVEAETRERCAQAAEKWRRKKLGFKPGTEWFDPCGRWDGEPLMEEGLDRDLIAAAIRNLEPRHD